MYVHVVGTLEDLALPDASLPQKRRPPDPAPAVQHASVIRLAAGLKRTTLLTHVCRRLRASTVVISVIWGAGVTSRLVASSPRVGPPQQLISAIVSTTRLIWATWLYIHQSVFAALNLKGRARVCAPQMRRHTYIYPCFCMFGKGHTT